MLPHILHNRCSVLHVILKCDILSSKIIKCTQHTTYNQHTKYNVGTVHCVLFVILYNTGGCPFCSSVCLSQILHLTCSAYISWNNGQILMFKVSKRPYQSSWHDEIIYRWRHNPSGGENLNKTTLGENWKFAHFSAYIFWNNGRILIFKVSKRLYKSPLQDRIICK